MRSGSQPAKQWSSVFPSACLWRRQTRSIIIVTGTFALKAVALIFLDEVAKFILEFIECHFAPAIAADSRIKIVLFGHQGKSGIFADIDSKTAAVDFLRGFVVVFFVPDNVLLHVTQFS